MMITFKFVLAETTTRVQALATRRSRLYRAPRRGNEAGVPPFPRAIRGSSGHPRRHACDAHVSYVQWLPCREVLQRRSTKDGFEKSRIGRESEDGGGTRISEERSAPQISLSDQRLLKTVCRLTLALRTWWRFCSDECAMPQRRRSADTHGSERQMIGSSLITGVQGVAWCCNSSVTSTPAIIAPIVLYKSVAALNSFGSVESVEFPIGASPIGQLGHQPSMRTCTKTWTPPEDMSLLARKRERDL